MDWIDKLQETLVKEAAGFFESRKIEKDEFRSYVANLTSVDDWDEDFIEICYIKYLEKINTAGIELTDKMME